MWSTMCWRTTCSMRSVARAGRTKSTAPTSVVVRNVTKLLCVCGFIYLFLFSRPIDFLKHRAVIFFVFIRSLWFVCPFTEVLQEIRRDITRKVWILLKRPASVPPSRDYGVAGQDRFERKGTKRTGYWLADTNSTNSH